jgi:hypothetical protein
MKNWKIFSHFKKSKDINIKKECISDTDFIRIISPHSNGFIIISSSSENFEELKKIVRDNKFNFIVVYGEFIEGGEKFKKPTLFIPNKEPYDSTFSEDKLFNLGIELSKKYNQRTFIYKPLNRENKTYSISEYGKITNTYIDQEINRIYKLYFKNLYGESDRTFENFYINKSPKSTSEASLRYGEYFFNIKK